MKVGKKGVSDSNGLKYYLCVKYWLCNQEVAISEPTGLSILFSFSFLMIGPRLTE